MFKEDLMNFTELVEHKLSKCKLTDNGCIEWIGPFAGRYGYINYNYCKFLAHRIIYQLKKGPIPEGLEIHHRCKNGICVNVDHLEVVTHSANISASNEYATKNKLSYSIANNIRNEYKEGKTNHRDLAKKYNVHKSSITRLLAGRSWNE